MMMTPQTLPDKLPAERVAVYLQLSSAIGTDTISGLPEFASDPTGLVFSSLATVDDAQTAAAMVAGGEAGTVYVVSALCTMTSGEVLEPVVALPVVEPVQATIVRRPVTL